MKSLRGSFHTLYSNFAISLPQPIHRFHRKTGITVELGDLRLILPWPLPVRDYTGFNEDWLHCRFSVRPGVTCLWQVGGRSSITFDQWMRLDMQYIDQWSLWLDMKILAKTIPAVAKGAGATRGNCD